MANELGLRNVAFEVSDLQAAVERAATEGYGLVGGIGEYEGAWRMAYVRGPEGMTGEIVFWTADTGIDGQTPVDIDELDLVCIGPLPSGSGTRTWPTSPNRSPMSGRGAGWPGHPGQGSLPPAQGRAPRRVSGPGASLVRHPFLLAPGIPRLPARSHSLTGTAAAIR